MFVIETFYKGDNCNNHQHKCKEVIICNVHKHHPFLKTRNRWEHVPGCLIKYIIVTVHTLRACTVTASAHLKSPTARGAMRQWRMFSTYRSGAKTRCPETITSSATMPCSRVHGTV